jgi:hypothetical protein
VVWALLFLPIFAISFVVLAIRLPPVGLVLGGIVGLVGLAFVALHRDSLTSDLDADTGRYLTFAGGVIVAISLTSRALQRRRDRYDDRVPKARAIKR